MDFLFVNQTLRLLTYKDKLGKYIDKKCKWRMQACCVQIQALLRPTAGCPPHPTPVSSHATAVLAHAVPCLASLPIALLANPFKMLAGSHRWPPSPPLRRPFAACSPATTAARLPVVHTRSTADAAAAGAGVSSSSMDPGSVPGFRLPKAAYKFTEDMYQLQQQSVERANWASQLR